MRYNKRRDTTHNAIAAVLESAGVQVLHVDGAIDLLALDAQSGLHMIECKSGDKAPKTERQQRMIRDGWPLEILASTDDAVDAVMKWRGRR